MYRMQITVEGVGRGLLMHRFGAAATAGVEAEVKRSKRTQTSPADEAEQGAFRFETTNGHLGQLYLPAEHFLGALIKAGSSFQQKGRGKKTYRSSFQGNVEIEPDYIGLTDKDGEPLREYKIDSRPVRMKATGGRIIRHRAHLLVWRATFGMLVMDDGLPPEVAQSVLEEAGRSSCVGDYRPRYGQFRIVSCEKEEV